MVLDLRSTPLGCGSGIVGKLVSIIIRWSHNREFPSSRMIDPGFPASCLRLRFGPETQVCIRVKRTRGFLGTKRVLPAPLGYFDFHIRRLLERILQEGSGLFSSISPKTQKHRLIKVQSSCPPGARFGLNALSWGRYNIRLDVYGR